MAYRHIIYLGLYVHGASKYGDTSEIQADMVSQELLRTTLHFHGCRNKESNCAGVSNGPLAGIPNVVNSLYLFKALN